MPLVMWTRDLETGFDDIDTQHMALVDAINRFHDAYQDHHFVDSKIALEDLIGVAANHFVHEEQMLADAQYHMLDAHKKVHLHFLEKIKELQGRFENGDADAADELFTLLDGWLFRHIRLNDHGYVDIVKSSGIR